MKVQLPPGRSQYLRIQTGDEQALVHGTANIVGDVEIGHNTRIDGLVTITGKVRIGRNCHIGTGVCIYGSEGVVIGDHCALSAGVKVFTMSIDPDDELLALHAGSLLDRGRGISGAVRIGNYTTIGANSVILPGARVGDEVVVGALSVVRGVLRSAGVYIGPSRLLRMRKRLRYGRRVERTA